MTIDELEDRIRRLLEETEAKKKASERLLSKHESRLTQIRLMIEEMQAGQKFGDDGFGYIVANDFIKKVALLVDRPFLHKPRFDEL